jgi:hypothetical protein
MGVAHLQCLGIAFHLKIRMTSESLLTESQPRSREVFPMCPVPTLPKSPTWIRVLLVGRGGIAPFISGFKGTRTAVIQCIESRRTVARQEFPIRAIRTGILSLKSRAFA